MRFSTYTTVRCKAALPFSVTPSKALSGIGANGGIAREIAKVVAGKTGEGKRNHWV